MRKKIYLINQELLRPYKNSMRARNGVVRAKYAYSPPFIEHEVG